jgi:hypothetical protein
LLGDDLQYESFEDETWLLGPAAHICHPASAAPTPDDVRFCEEILIDRATYLDEALRFFRLSYPDASEGAASDACVIVRVPNQVEVLFQTCELPIYNNGVLVEFEGNRAVAVVIVDDTCE